MTIRKTLPDTDYVPGLSAENNPRRGGNFRTATPEMQEEALKGLESFGSKLPQRINETIASETRVLSGTARPQRKKEAKGIINRLSSLSEQLKGTPTTGMGRSVRAISEAAQMPVEAARLQSRETGKLIIPQAGLFYPEKLTMSAEAALSHSHDPRHVVSTLLATPELSPLSDPQTETQGGAALSFLKAYGHHGSVTLTDENVKQINSDLMNKKGKTHSKDFIKHSGTHILSTLPPSVLAGLAAHHRASEGGKTATTSHWFEGSHINAPGDLSSALVDFGNFGAGGWTKGSRAARMFDDPFTHFSEMTKGGQHKARSYTLNTIKNTNDLYKAGVHHYLGVLTHGDAWHQENPDAASILGHASKLPAWRDTTYTGDVHSSQLAVGLEPGLRTGLGDIQRPEELFKGATVLKTRGGQGHPFLQTSPDMGYYIGEEAHNRVARSKNFTIDVAGSRYNAPVEVVQALGWAGKQAQDKGESLKRIRSAEFHSSIIDPNTINQLSPLRKYRG